MLVFLVAEHVFPLGVEEADVRVIAGAGETRERLGHERGDVAVQVRELLDRVLEREADVRPGHARSRREGRLELGARVLAVVGDDVDAERP